MDATSHALAQGGLADTAEVLPSLWPADGGSIDLCDKAISRSITSLEIGVLEWPASVPGCAFGMGTTLFAGPLTLAALTTDESWPPVVPMGIFRVFVLAVWAAILYIWFMLCSGREEYARKYLFRGPVYLIGPILGIAVARLAGPRACFTGAWFIIAWWVNMLPVFILKKLTRRRRPTVCGPDLVPQTPRVIEIIPRLLKQDANASFPSGDVAGAAAFAWALTFGCGLPAAVGVVVVVLSAFGRMYWRAHHFLDISVGAGIGLLGSAATGRLVDINSVTW